MITTKINIKLLEALINFDFFIFESKESSKTISRQFNKNILINSNLGLKNYYTLDPLEIIKDLKRIIRILQFSKEEDFSLKLNFGESTYNRELFHLAMTDNNEMPQQIQFDHDDLYHFDIKRDEEGVSALIGASLNYKSYNRLFDNNKYIILEFNSEIIKNNLGTYRLFLNPKDWKKIIFLSLLIRKIYKIT